MGRLAAPAAKAKAKAKAKSAPPPPTPPPPMPTAPIGRMPALSFEVMDVAAWYTAMLAAINDASEVIVGTYQYDHENLTDALERRLRGREAFECVVMLDKEMHGARTPHYQRSRLERLRRAGATVVLCRGTPSTGAFHAKAVVCDRKSAFLGSPNMTNKSMRNGELCYRLKGPPVLDVLQFLQQERAGGQVVG